MVRVTGRVIEGAWYYEIKVVKLGETGHTWLGWCTVKGDLQASVGYDGNSFGYMDIDGSKLHRALREKYGDEGYKEGLLLVFISICHREDNMHLSHLILFGIRDRDMFVHGFQGRST